MYIPLVLVAYSEDSVKQCASGNSKLGPTTQNPTYPRTSHSRGQEPSSLTPSASRARGTNLQLEKPPGCVSTTMRFGLEEPSSGLYGGTFDAA